MDVYCNCSLERFGDILPQSGISPSDKDEGSSKMGSENWIIVLFEFGNSVIFSERIVRYTPPWDVLSFRLTVSLPFGVVPF